MTALERQRSRQILERAQWAECYEDRELVFAQVNGKPLRPDRVLDRFHELNAQAGLPRVRLQDLRHLAATLMQMGGVASDASLDKIRERPLPATSPFRLTMISVDERAVTTSDQAISLAVAVDDTMLHQILLHHMPNRCIRCN